MHDSNKPVADCIPGAEVRWTLSVLGATVHQRQKVADGDLKAPIEVARLLAFTDRHAVTALLAWQLKTSGQLDELDPPLAEALTASFHASIARAFTQLDELSRTIKELQNSGIAAIPWKGPVLAHRIFGEPAARECSDLDILVAPECLPAAGSILHSLGYLQVENEAEVRAVLNEDHCITYRHNSRPVFIELHRRPFPSSFPFPLEFDDMNLPGNPPRLIGKHSFPAMTADCELLLSAAHAAKHLWTRLAWIADIARLAEGMSAAEAAALDLKARQSRCHRAVQVSLLLAEDLLQAVIPPPLKACFEPTAEARHLAGTIRRRILNADAPLESAPSSPGAWITTQLLAVRSRESIRDRIHIAGCSLRYAMASNVNDREFIPGIRLPQGLAFLFRPIRLLANFVNRLL